MFFTESGPRNLWDSFQDMERILDSMNRAFRVGQSGWSASQPRMNVWADDHKILIAAELPGIDPAQVDISVQGDVLTLRGRRSANGEQGQYRLRERADLDFERTLTLPFRVDADRTEARYAKGLLGVTLYRHADERPRRIEVKTG